MLQQNGPEPQTSADVIDTTPRDQCLYCGCLTRQSRCPECGASLSHPSLVRRKALVGFVPSPLRLYAVDKKVGEDWRPVTHSLSSSEMEADRSARESFNIPDDIETRIAPMLNGELVKWKRVPMVEMLAENEVPEQGDEGGEAIE